MNQDIYSLCAYYYTQETHNKWIEIGAYASYMGKGSANKHNQKHEGSNSQEWHQGADGAVYHSSVILMVCD